MTKHHIKKGAADKMGNLFNTKKTKQNQVSTESKPDRIASTPLFSDDAQSSLDRSRQESAILEVNNDPPCSSKADQGQSSPTQEDLNNSRSLADIFGELSSMSQTVTALVTRGMSWDAHEDKLDPKIRKKVLELKEKLVKVKVGEEHKVHFAGLMTKRSDIFWVTLAEVNPNIRQVQSMIHDEYKDKSWVKMDKLNRAKIGDKVVAQFPEDNVLYRGRLEALGDKGVDTGHRLLKVRFIDFGNVAEVEGFAIFENYDALDAIPPQAFSCCLTELSTRKRKKIMKLIQKVQMFACKIDGMDATIFSSVHTKISLVLNYSAAEVDFSKTEYETAESASSRSEAEPVWHMPDRRVCPEISTMVRSWLDEARRFKEVLDNPVPVEVPKEKLVPRCEIAEPGRPEDFLNRTFDSAASFADMEEGIPVADIDADNCPDLVFIDMGMPRDCSLKLFVTEVMSSDEFYAVDLERRLDLEVIENELRSVYGPRQAELTGLVINSCWIYFNPKYCRYYRVRVENVDPVVVRLIDAGSIIQVKQIEHLFWLPAGILRTSPGIVLLCHLAGTGRCTINNFVRHVLDGQEVQGFVEELKADSLGLTVITEDGENLNSLLLNLMNGQEGGDTRSHSIDDDQSETSLRQDDDDDDDHFGSWDPLGKDYRGPMNNFNTADNDPTVAFTGYKETAPQCPHFLLYGEERCPRGQFCPKSHSTLRYGATVAEKVSVSHFMKNKPGPWMQRVPVELKNVRSPSNFTLVCKYVTHSLGKFSHQDIAAEIEGETQTMDRNLDLEISKVVAFKHRAYGWSRAKIMDYSQVNGEEGALLYLVDRDDTLVVPTRQLKELPVCVAEIPDMAVVCSLMNVSPRGSKFWSSSATAELKKIGSSPNSLTAEIHELPECEMNQANLFLNSTETVADKLIKKGLCISSEFYR